MNSIFLGDLAVTLGFVVGFIGFAIMIANIMVENNDLDKEIEKLEDEIGELEKDIGELINEIHIGTYYEGYRSLMNELEMEVIKNRKNIYFDNPKHYKEGL